MAPPNVSRFQKIRGGVWATGMAIIVIAGTWYGAGLRTERDFEQAKKQILEASVEDKIAVLEAQKEHLYAQKATIQRKLDVFHARVRERERLRQKEAEEKAREAEGR
ncbi:uncharacterized protein DNG_06494 [Cephalotrichum gorgonifer]|uniref:Uncharacterized protein n=1 Tax=Cephalotrichum gorgonifer TaxID=2041049 RepID=A0AAE8SWI0_9PEZI|nr:uncharacterized protein DNG_06494 [Cephalotrichum gorgonifer]